MAKRPEDRFQSAGDFGRAVSAGAIGSTDIGGERTVATGDAATADAQAPTTIAPIPATDLAGGPSADAGAPPTRTNAPTRRAPRPWAVAAIAAVLVAVVGVAVALGTAGSGTTTTTSTASSTPISTPTTASTTTTTSSSTATTPVAKPTSAQIFSAVNSGGGLAAAVTRHANGSCFTSSNVIARSDAWRCSVGNELYDPCFTVNQTQVLCPNDGPWANRGILVNVPGGLTNSTGVKDQGTSGLPWAIQLADGSRCLPIGGASNVIANQRLNFDCTGGLGLYGNVQRSGEVWMIYAGAPHSAQITLRPIAIAWF
jgi:eukaryotic-like serine/threonine-protein kinase